MSIATAPLGEVAPAKPISMQKDPDEPVWQITLDHIEADTGKLLKRELKPFSKAGTSTHAFDESHVLYSKLRPYLNKVLIPDREGIGTTELVPMLPDPKRLERGYLAHYLMTKRFVTWINEHSNGAKMPRVAMTDFWAHEIPLPPLPEQKRIVDILDKADAIRRKRRQAIELADQFLRSVFLDLFGDPIMNPKGWDVLKMGDVIDFKGGNQPPKETFISEPREGYVRLVQIRDFKTDKYPTYIPSDLARRQFEKDDVMIARYGPPVFQILRGLEGSYNVALMKAEPKADISKDFIFHLLPLPAFHDRVVAASERTAGQTGVNLDLLNEFDVPLPPRSAQNEIMERVAVVEQSMGRLRKFLADAETLFASLSQRAFAGEL